MLGGTKGGSDLLLVVVGGAALGLAAMRLAGVLLGPRVSRGPWRLLACASLGAATLGRLSWLRLAGVDAAELALLFLLLLTVSLTDLDARVIPNPCVGAVVLLRAGALAARVPEGAAGVANAAGSLASGVAMLALLLVSTRVARRLLGEAGMGAGDLKLLSALALFTGFERGLLLLALASALGLAHGLCLRARLGERGFPWGPGIALAAWLVLLWVP